MDRYIGEWTGARWVVGSWVSGQVQGGLLGAG